MVINSLSVYTCVFVYASTHVVDSTYMCIHVAVHYTCLLFALVLSQFAFAQQG